MTVAKDVKVQVEFNPSRVQSYRLLGYENRMLETQDFDDDNKDAGEIGAGHRVTALYEVVPVGAAQATDASQLRYSQNKVAPLADKGEAEDELGGELLAVKLRYKKPEGDRSKLLLFPLEDSELEFEKADRDFRWAASMAEFGMLLRGSRYAGQASWSKLLEQAIAAAGVSPDATRQECLEMIRSSARLKGADAAVRGGR
jgi:Ca-activated chloride channel family protein